MNIKQERTHSMQVAVVKFCDANPSKLTVLPNYSIIYSAYKATVDEIKDIAFLQASTTTKDTTQFKVELRRLHTLKSMKIIKSLKPYYDFLEDYTHKNFLEIVINDLNKLADNNYIVKAKEIHDLALTVVANLVPYGITAAFLTDYKTDLDVFANIAPDPRLATVSRAGYTEQLITLFEKSKVQQDRLSNLIGLTEFTDVNFFNLYKNTTRVISAGTRSIAFRANIKDTNGLAINKFTFTFMRQSDSEVAQYKVNANGTLQRQTLKAGIYELTITKTDYTPLTGKIVIISGETYTLNVVVDTATKTISSGINTKTGEVMGV